MPLVFVHGVNTRKGDTFAEQQAFTNRVEFFRQQFREGTFRDRVNHPEGLQVFLPYWGDIGVLFRRGLACLPQQGIESLSLDSPEMRPVAAAVVRSLDGITLWAEGLAEAPLLTLARQRSLGAAVDLLTAGAAHAPVPDVLLDPAEMPATLSNAAEFFDAAERYAARNPNPAWLVTTAGDEEFVCTLLVEALAFRREKVADNGAVAPTPTSVQTLGLGSALNTLLDNAAAAVRNMVGRVLGAAGAAIQHTATEGTRDSFMFLSGFVRPSASAFVARFFGDIFTYMENRQPIVTRTLADIDLAVSAKRPGDDELYLVGHSFGGIILYDILSKFRPNLQCDLLVTVGSQIALFAEIGRLADSNAIDLSFAAGATATAPRPINVKRWLNVFDPTDIVGFGTRGVFSGVKDFQFETEAFPIVSHGAYFDTPRFYARLRERIQEAFMNGTD